MNDQPGVYTTQTCRSTFTRLTPEDEEQCKKRNSFPSVNENPWVNKFIQAKKK